MSRHLLAALVLLVLRAPARGNELPLDRIELPPGFHIAVYAHVEGARSLALGARGTVFVGTRRPGKVYALVGTPPRVVTIAQHLDEPNGVAFRDGALYVAEVTRILRFDGIEQHLDAPPAPVTIRDDYPAQKDHGWKLIAFGPDGLLYVPVGMPCNVCDRKDPLYGTVTRLSPDGKRRDIFVTGLRNSVGFDWSPRGVLWLTDNGRDELGDDRPDDVLDQVPHAGLDFGFPYCDAGDLPDPKYGKGHTCSDYSQPAARLGPHVAALGMRFYGGTMFPAAYRGNVFIAEHGSWNRKVPIGYRVVRAILDGDKVTSVEPFATGWLPAQPRATGAWRPSPQAWGRPVDVLVMPDGALLVSDDRADAVYRIWY